MEAVADGLEAVSIAKRAVHASMKAMITNFDMVAKSLTEACKYVEAPYEDLKTSLKDLKGIFPTAVAVAISDQVTSLEKKITSNYFGCLSCQIGEVSLNLNDVPKLIKHVHEGYESVHDAMKIIMSDSEILSGRENVLNKDLKDVVTATESSKTLLADIKRTRTDFKLLRAVMELASSGLRAAIISMKHLFERLEYASALLEHICKCISTVLKGKKDLSEALLNVLYYKH